MSTHVYPPALSRLARALLVLALLIGLTPAAIPVAHAADGCGYQQTYGPYGALVGAQTPELSLALTLCMPDQTNTVVEVPRDSSVLSPIAKPIIGLFV
jgi:hypothetical protein